MVQIPVPGRLVGDLAHEGRVAVRDEVWFGSVKEALSSAANTDAEAAIAIMDRFQLMPVMADGRLVLSPAVQAHVAASDGGFVRLVVADGSLTLWSERRWQAERADRMALADRLLVDCPH
jgi:hypothetical protein